MMTRLALFLLFTRVCFAEYPEEGVTYSYPFYYDDSDFNDDFDKPDVSKNKEPPAWEGKIGNVDVTVDVEKPDFFSECQAERDRMKKKKEDPKEDHRSHFRKHDDQKKDQSVSIKGSVKW